MSIQVLAASQFPAHHLKQLQMSDPSHNGDSTCGRVGGEVSDLGASEP